MGIPQIEREPPIEHDYFVDTEICSTTDSWCTLENIACWARHLHAPDKKDGYGEAVAHGKTVDLEYALTDNPIRVAIGPEFGLPANAVAQIMREGHFFHSEEMADWGPGEFQCPKRVPNHGEGAPPEHCNQVYREPYKKGNKIFMYTRGTGNSGTDRNRINENTGRALFDELDGEMTDAIWQDIDHWCPDLAPPRLPPRPGDGELP